MSSISAAVQLGLVKCGYQAFLRPCAVARERRRNIAWYHARCQFIFAL